MMSSTSSNKVEQIQKSQSTYNETWTSTRLRKSTRRRLQSKRIPPESYDDIINRICDEHHNERVGVR